ncbi:MAG TPA: hypothetical protein VL654_14430 [Casimicrobiaceae bacterium]|jgi:hypothetical protein|nr:hypothetical protein [Casimicrobiaceae bacterium]
MDTRNGNQSRNRWATGVRAATLVIVTGTLAAVWYPTHHDRAAATIGDVTAPAVTAPDMSAYFPDRFPAPQGPIEPLPPQF